MPVRQRDAARAAATHPAAAEDPIARAAESATEIADVATLVPPEVRERMVREAAYYRAERRGFAAGHELEDWLSAEADIDRLLALETRIAS
ncbi:MAG: DUF2934 domain-containing protein [Burkholderiales bacterium]|nr:DUF2934 domain-containing protein [Burkholderiales bacterium]